MLESSLTLDEQHRNPKTYLSLKHAKALLMTYTGMKEPPPTDPYALHTSKSICLHSLNDLENVNCSLKKIDHFKQID